MDTPEIYLNAIKNLSKKENLLWTELNKHSFQLFKKDKKFIVTLKNDSFQIQFKGLDFHDDFIVHEGDLGYTDIERLYHIATCNNVKILQAINEFLDSLNK